MKKSKPEMHMIGPTWFHHHGHKMHVSQILSGRVLYLRASAASLKIRHPSEDENDWNRWLIEWEVIFSRSEKVNGAIQVSQEELLAAFGLGNIESEYSQWLLDRFGGDVAAQGRFIRYQEFLNIPCPGTGHDGDPNVSILLDDEIKEAIRAITKT